MLEEDASGVFIQDTHGICYMLAVSDVDTVISWLEKHADETFDLMMIIGEDVATHVQDKLKLPGRMDVYQAVYEADTPPHYKPRLRMEVAMDADKAFIREHYSNLDEGELQELIRYGHIYMGYDTKGAPVGFVGQHMEGSMGLLEILPAYQRKGYGAELESFMIGEMLRQGLIPYCHFKTDNHPSRALQKKLGLTITDDVITWLWR